MGFFKLLTRGRRRPMPFVPYTFFSAALFVMGCAVLAVFAFIYDAEKQTEEWPTAEGVVWASRLIPGPGGPGLEFEYRFTVGGTTYRSGLINSGQYRIVDWGSGQVDPQEVVQKYPARSQVTVYYASANPRHSLLEPGLTRWTRWGLAVGVLLVALGVWLYFKRPFREMDKLEEYETDIRL